MISLKQLNYALAVGRTLHFKKAADQCNVSQSALSTALSELENQLGLQIFERNNKKVMVTPIGKQVLEHAKRVLLGVEDLKQLAQSQGDPLSFPISIGIIPTIAPFLLPIIFPVLQQQYPAAQLNIIEGESATLVEMLRQGELDSAILALPFPCDGLLTLEFWHEDFYWIALKTAAYAERNEISSAELAEADLMLLSEGHCLKDHVLDVCKLPRNSHKRPLEAVSLNTLVQMVQGNLGTTLIPQMALPQLTQSNPELQAIHLNEPSPHRRIAFVIRPNFTRTNSVEALKQICQQALSVGGGLAGQ